MRFKIRFISIEIKTWLRTIWYNIKNYKKIKEQKRLRLIEEKKTPEEKMKEALAKKSPEELKRINNRIKKLQLRGQPIICVKCGSSVINKQTGSFHKILNKGSEVYVHERCR
jgi:hypothetical protein